MAASAVEYQALTRTPALAATATIEEQMGAAKKDLKEARLEFEHQKAERDKITGIWTGKMASLQEEIGDKRVEVEGLRLRLQDVVERRKVGGLPPPGPKSLKYVEGDTFLLLGMAVIICNLITIVLEAKDDQWLAYLYWVDQFFLVFYIGELLLKAIYYQKQLLIGPVSIVWWNWLDLIIVVTGIITTWVLPAVTESDSTSSGASLMSYIRVLRLARLIRVCKLVRIFIQSDFAWADGDRFQTFMMAVIGLNAILMGVETETHQWAWFWFWVENALLLIYVFELLLRLRRGGRLFFIGKEVAWNYMDFAIVLGGVVDQWLVPAYDTLRALARHGRPVVDAADEGGLDIGQLMRLLRIARLLRILRVVRLIRSIPPLYSLVLGIGKALQGMVWVLALTTTVLYICALLGGKLLGPDGLLWVGHGSLWNPGKRVPHKVKHCFPDMWGSVFNLFTAMNGDLSPWEPLFEYMPIWKCIAAMYVVITNWAIFSILTAVVCDNMARTTTEVQDEVSECERKARYTKLVDSIFQAVDSAGVDEITEQQLQAFLDKKESANAICEAADLTPDEVQECFQVFSQKKGEKGACITRESLFARLSQETSNVSQRALMRVEKRLDAMFARLAYEKSLVVQGLAAVQAEPHLTGN